MEKKVFVVIITYNGEFWIEKNCSSLLNSTYPVEIIVVDNNSTDNSVNLLKRFPEIHLILSDKNLGFGKANNIGIEKALKKGADFVFLLNQDAWVFKDTIEKLVEKAEKNENFGIISPLHFSGDGINLDKNFEVYFKRKIAEIPEQDMIEVLFVNAAAWLVSKECFKKVGLFDPIFNHYGEDRNFCNRVIYHNFKIGIKKNAKICHDRIIKRDFNKDCTQATYKVLNSLLNINTNLVKSYFYGLKEVVGLPNYFLKFYSFSLCFQMFLKLFFYFFNYSFRINTLISNRRNSKMSFSTL